MSLRYRKVKSCNERIPMNLQKSITGKFLPKPGAKRKRRYISVAARRQMAEDRVARNERIVGLAVAGASLAGIAASNKLTVNGVRAILRAAGCLHTWRGVWVMPAKQGDDDDMSNPWFRDGLRLAMVE